MNCSNCNNELTDNYCAHCGQRSITRFTWSMVMSWIRDEVFVLDRGFFFTLKELLLHPVTVVNNYLAGSTKKYFNPFKLLIILSTAPVAILLYFDEGASTSVADLLKDCPTAFTNESFNYLLINWPRIMVPNLLYHLITTTILMSAFSRFMFRSRGLNLLEHLIFTCYIASFIILINFCTAPVWLIKRWLTDTQFLILISITYLLCIGYLVKTVKHFFQERYWKVIVKGIFSIYPAIGISMGLELVALSVAKAVYDLI